MGKNKKDDIYLTGKMLLAMPSMMDPRFFRSVIYLCAHSEDGAMGIIINHPLEGVEFKELMEQLELPTPDVTLEEPVHFGGPVETGRGFVLHSTDYLRDGSLPINEDLALTGTTDILKDIADGNGPKKHIFVLGYAGWGPGQLETEIQENTWLNMDADAEIIFSGGNTSNKWEKALQRLGINPAMLSDQAGHA